MISAPPERRGAANATYFTGFDAGLGLGSLLAGFLANALGYSTMFGILSVPMLFAAGIYLVTERQKSQHQTEPSSSTISAVETEA